MTRPDTEKIREKLEEIKDDITGMTLSRDAKARKIAYVRPLADTLEKVLDECEPWLDEYPDHDGLGDRILDIIQNGLCEEADDE
jgi:tetrahydromethanopterin S-methyltransferase subunit B